MWEGGRESGATRRRLKRLRIVVVVVVVVVVPEGPRASLGRGAVDGWARAGKRPGLRAWTDGGGFFRAARCCHLA